MNTQKYGSQIDLVYPRLVAMALTAALGVVMMLLGCALHFPGQRYSRPLGSSDYNGSVSVHLVQLKMLTGGEYLLVSHDFKACYLSARSHVTSLSIVLFYLLSPLPLALSRKCASDDHISPESR